jgi:hypothetical protein
MKKDAKKPYKAPKLTKLGDVGKVTANKGGIPNENSNGHGKGKSAGSLSFGGK